MTKKEPNSRPRKAETPAWEAFQMNLSESILAGDLLIPFSEVPAIANWTRVQQMRARRNGLPAVKLPGFKEHRTTVQAVTQWLAEQARPLAEKAKAKPSMSNRLAKHNLA